MREVERLRRELTATMDGDPWCGSAVTNILNGISADKAAAHPINGAHSIWELVAHMTAWANEVEKRRASGGPHRPPAEETGPPSDRRRRRHGMKRSGHCAGPTTISPGQSKRPKTRA